MMIKISTENLLDFKKVGNAGMHKEIAHYLKEKIESGKFKSSEQLPSLRALAKLWETNIFSVKLATDILVEYGLLNKPHGKGMFIAPKSKDIFRVGLYSSKTLGGPVDLTFYSTLRDLVGVELQKRNIEYITWDDYRPKSEHHCPPTEIRQAVLENKVQAVIGIIVRSYDYRWFRKLPIKKVQMMKDPMLDYKEIVDRLKERGCRRIALIAPLTPKDSVQFLLDGIKDAGINILPRNRILIDESAISHQNWSAIGYEKTMELLNRKLRPDGLIVYPDNSVPGAIQAILEKGVKVPEELFVLFHRNIELSYFCSLQASYIDTSIGSIATRLVNSALSTPEK